MEKTLDEIAEVLEEEEKRESIDSLLKGIAFTLASEIKDEKFTAKVIGYRVKQDRHGRNIFVLMVEHPDYGTVVIAYSPAYARILLQKLKEMKIESIDEFVNSCFEFQKIKLPKMRKDYTEPYPRYIPVKKVSC